MTFTSIQPFSAAAAENVQRGREREREKCSLVGVLVAQKEPCAAAATAASRPSEMCARPPPELSRARSARLVKEEGEEEKEEWSGTEEHF